MGSPGKADTSRGPSPPDETETPQALARGADWYADPYGSGTDQRWYDGRKWTNHVRVGDDASPGPQLRPRPARHAQPGGQVLPAVGPKRQASPAPEPKPQAPQAPKPPSEATEFPVRVADTVGRRLWLVDSGSRRRFGYHLLSDSGRVASLRLFDRSRLATVGAADGSWWLTNRSRTGWELLLRGADGAQIGSYSGRRWRTGGTIALTVGQEAELMRTLTGTWKLRYASAREPLASIRPGGRPGETRTAVTVHSLAEGGRTGSLMILVACAVVMLEQSGPGVPTVAPAHRGVPRHLVRTGADRRPG